MSSQINYVFCTFITDRKLIILLVEYPSHLIRVGQKSLSGMMK